MAVSNNVRVVMTPQELLTEVASVVPHGHARRLITRARRVAGIGRTREADLEPLELLMILESIERDAAVRAARTRALSTDGDIKPLGGALRPHNRAA